MGIAEVVAVLLSVQDEEAVPRAAQHFQSAMGGEAVPSLVRLILDLPVKCVGCLNFW
jgi:hypothetical protein